MLSFLLFYLDTFILSKNKTAEAPQTIKQKQKLTRNFGKNYWFQNTSEAYLDPSRTPTMELFCENYFRKNLHYRCSTGF